MSRITATPYPLSWPADQDRRRSYDRRGASYDRKRSLSAAAAFVMGELRRLGADAGAVISCNVRTPYSEQRIPEDPAVAVHFLLRGEAHVLACDQWTRVQDNLWAIGLHIEALRALKRTGVGTQAQAFAGYKALPPPALAEPEAPPEPWHEVLQVAPEAPVEIIDAAYRAHARTAHPDHGGTAEKLARLQRARDAGRAARTVPGDTTP